MTKINLQQLLKKGFIRWTDEERLFFLYDLLDHHKKPIPGYSETMLDSVIYAPNERLNYNE